MVSEIFEVIGDAISGLITDLTSAVTSITAMFYTPGTNGAAGEFTFLGILLLVGAGAGIVFWVVYLIKNAIQVPVK